MDFVEDDDISDTIDEIFKNCQALHRSAYPTTSIDFEDLDLTLRVKHSRHAAGRGHYSDVYKGKLDNSILVGVKLLRLPSYSPGKESLYQTILFRFFREFTHWHGLDHINVARLLGFTLAGGNIGFVSLWYHHGDLVQHLSEHPDASKEDLILDVAEGIQYIHTHPQPVLHGDLKGANILVNEHGVACLGDFGISRQVRDLNRKTGFTTTSGVTGTVPWMAPELLDKPSLSFSSDIYSFGGIVIEICCPGKYPYHYLSQETQIMLAKVRGGLPDRAHYPELDHQGALWDFIITCLAHDSQERPNITDVVQNLYRQFGLAPRAVVSTSCRQRLSFTGECSKGEAVDAENVINVLAQSLDNLLELSQDPDDDPKLTRVSTEISRVFEKVSPSRKRSGSGSTTGTGTGTGRSRTGASGQEEYNLVDASGGHLPMPVSTSGHGGSSAPVISGAKARFQRTVKKAIPSQSQHLTHQMRQQSVVVSVSDHTRGKSAELYATRPPRFTILQPTLKKLVATQCLEQHSALVCHLQFSPDGKYLATASWDRGAILWKVGDPFQMHEILLHPVGYVNQVTWSPDGERLLTRTAKQIKIWTNTGLCMRTINRQREVQALTWMPSGKSFLCVERSTVHILDTAGKELETHLIDRIRIHDVGVTLDEHRLVIVGKLERSKDSLKPSKSRPKNRIIIYDLEDRYIESQAPVLENIQDVTISRDGAHALVSYEDTTYPELWGINLVKAEPHLNLQNTYITPSPVHFAGPSYFGGVNDQFVICAGKPGDIYIWDKETAMLLHCIQASQPGGGDNSGDLTAIGWNHCSPGKFMLASATHDGAVRIWTAPAPPETPPSSRAGLEPFPHRGRGMTSTSLSTTAES